MNKYLLAAGGGIIMLGGLAYYLLQQNNGGGETYCSNYHSDDECTGHGCYWCNGICQSTPCGQEKCADAIMGECHENLYGWRKCDFFHNLCECNNGTWTCIDDDSIVCRDNIKYKKCFFNTEDVVNCG